MKTQLSRAIALAALSLLLASSSVDAVDLSVQKMFGQWSQNPTNYLMGNLPASTALSEKWAVVGCHYASERGVNDEGAVQVFNAATGAWTRKLLPPSPAAALQFFGNAVATSGDQVVVGAYLKNSEAGAAYVYQMPKGTLLYKLTAIDAAALDRYGWNVATNGEIIAVGAPGDDGARGSVYFYRAQTGAFLFKLVAPASGGSFGFSLALEGSLIAIGAPSANSHRGLVYVYDSQGFALLRTIQTSASVAGDRVGTSVAMHEGRLVTGGGGKATLINLTLGTENILNTGGTTGSTFGSSAATSGPLITVSDNTVSNGRCHVFDSRTGAFIQTVTPPSSDTLSGNFASSVALHGSVLLVTSAYDTVQGFDAGAAYLIRPLLNAPPFTKVVSKNDSAPGATNINYGNFGDVYVNSQNKLIFSSTLTGTGSNKGRDVATFTGMTTAEYLRLVNKSRVLFSTVGLPKSNTFLSANDNNISVGLTTLTGPGITSLNNQLLWYHTANFSYPFLRTGSPLSSPTFSSTNLNGTTVQQVQDLVTSNQGGARGLAAICKLRVGEGGVTANDDSALLSAKISDSTTSLREGSTPAPPVAGASRGQVAPRVALNYTSLIYSTALTGGSITADKNTAIFKKYHAAAETLVAQKGDVAVDATGSSITNVRYSAFIGESANGNDGCAYRATLTGPPAQINSGNNEGVWLLTSSPSRRLAFRKGQSTSLPSGVKIARIVKFWAVGNTSASNAQCLALVQLSGTQVTSANDQALLLWQENATIAVLMREGDLAPGCTGARVGVINRVEVDAWSSTYAVIASLTNSAANSNLALFTGITMNRGNATTEVSLRRPFLRLRKGQRFENQPSSIKSIALPSKNTPASGAGGTGRGRALGYGGNIGFTIEFENGVRQIVTGNID